MRIGNVPSMRIFGRQEPRVVLHTRDPESRYFRYVGETEKGPSGQQNLVFKDKIRYLNFAKDSMLRFSIVDKKDGNCRHDDEVLCYVMRLVMTC